MINEKLQDIAVIKLPLPITFSRSVQPIELPRTSEADTSFLNSQAVVSGFGRTSDSSNQVSQNLNFVHMRISASSECAGIFGTKVVTNNVICARGSDNKQQNACLGGEMMIKFSSEFHKLKSF